MRGRPAIAVGLVLPLLAYATAAFAAPFTIPPPDSLSNPQTFREFIDQWHEFYLMAGTAAVTLAGLLFVALSLHIDLLVHDSRAHLLMLSRATLSSFILVLALSLVFLTPGLGRRILGTELVAFGSVFAVVTFVQLRRRPEGEDPRLKYEHLKQRFRLPMIGYIVTVWIGVCLVGSSRVDLQACKLEYSIVSPK